VAVEPHSGNSGIGYARLNVENGQKMMWEKPWTREVLASRPWVDGVGLADGIDFLRGIWDEKVQAMIVTVKRWQGDSQTISMKIRNLPRAQWAVYVNGSLRETREMPKGGDIAVSGEVGVDEVDIVVMGT